MKKTGKGKNFIIIAVIFLAAAAAVGIFLYGVLGKERLHLRINGTEISEEEYLQVFCRHLRREGGRQLLVRGVRRGDPVRKAG